MISYVLCNRNMSSSYFFCCFRWLGTGLHYFIYVFSQTYSLALDRNILWNFKQLAMLRPPLGLAEVYHVIEDTLISGRAIPSALWRCVSGWVCWNRGLYLGWADQDLCWTSLGAMTGTSMHPRSLTAGPEMSPSQKESSLPTIIFQGLS